MTATTTAGKTAVEQFRQYLNRYFDQPGSMSMRALGQKVGISHVHVRRLRNGQNTPSLDLAIQIADAIGFDLGKIVKTAVTSS